MNVQGNLFIHYLYLGIVYVDKTGIQPVRLVKKNQSN